jgi:Tol biopolymer transport system component
MTSNVSFDRDLRRWLDEKAGQRLPDYLDEVLELTAGASQRKRWSSLEWWLPLDSMRGLIATPLPATVRLVVVALAILALVGIVLVGAGLRRSAPPFGLAGNGVLAIANPEAILIADADGMNRRLLVAAKDGVESLTWSPDGTKLAFRTLSPITREPTVMVVDRDGSALIDATPGMAIVGFDQGISWSPDSTRLVVPSPDEDRGRLIVANADGSGARALDLQGGPRAIAAAAWSPNGEWIALVASYTGSSGLGLHLVRPDGSGDRFVGRVAPDSHGGPPTWAPDRDVERLLYIGEDGGVALYDASDGRHDRLSAPGNWPSWSPDGTEIAWWADGILVGNVDALLAGGSPRRLITVSGSCADRGRSRTNTPCGPPTWSPDGTRIYAPDISTKAVVALSVDGSQPPITIVLPPGTELNPIGSASWQRVARSWP